MATKERTTQAQKTLMKIQNTNTNTYVNTNTITNTVRTQRKEKPSKKIDFTLHFS